MEFSSPICALQPSTFRLFRLVGFFSFCLMAFAFPQVYGGTSTVQAVTRTVCASGCDHTTLAASFAAASSGDVVSVGATYATSTETFLFTGVAGTNATVPANITVDCNNSGATIGAASSTVPLVFKLSTSTVFQNCGVHNLQIYPGPASTVSGLTAVTSTVYGTSVYSPTSFVSDNAVISNNLYFSYIRFQSDSSVTVTSNTIHDYVDFVSLDFDTVLNSTMSSNTVYIFATNTVAGISINTSATTTVTGNTVEYRTNSELVNAQSMIVSDSQNITVSYNYISAADSTSDSAFETVRISGGATYTTTTVTLDHNTFIAEDGSSGNIGVFLFEGVTKAHVSTTLTYNIITTDGTTASGKAIATSFTTKTLVLNNSYNGIHNFTTNLTDVNSSTGATFGVTNVFASPNFRTKNAGTTDDLYPAPFSVYLDVNGTQDIGAYSATRGSSFTIDDNGTVDYTSIFATTTVDINSSTLKTGDTWSLSAGTYTRLTLASSTFATSSITISGAGATTILDASALTTPAISVTGLSSTAISSLVVQNSTSTVTTYTITKPIYTYGGNSYNDGSMIGQAGAALLINSGSCGATYITADGTDITAYIDGTSDVHLALINAGGGARLTALVPNNVATSAAQLASICSGLGVVVDKFVTSTLVASGGGSYTNLSSAALSALGVTMTATFTDPMVLTQTVSVAAGIYFNSASDNTVSSVTSTGNKYAFYFAGTSASNSINDSVATSSVTADIYSSASTDNAIKNTSFSYSSSTISSTGDVDVYYKTRVFVTSTSGVVAGAVATLTSANSSVSTTLTTDGTGYSSYSGYLLAHSMTSSSVALTSGGYNPYSVSVAATSTYSASSTSMTLDTVNESVTIAMAVLSAPTAPSSIATSSVATSSITWAWTDNSSDEASFLFDRITGSNAASFPGTTSSLASNATSTSVTSLSPNTQYMARVAAVSSNGTSAYTTSSAVYTLANAASAATVTASTTVALSISINVNSNSTDTTYAIYNSTDGVYLAASGASNGSTPVYQTTSTWGSAFAATGLTVNTAYQFTVIARNGDNINAATSSASTAVYTLASAPTSLSASAASATSLSVSWSGSGTSYVLSNDTLVTTSSVAGTSTTLTGLTCDTSYTLSVKAINGDGVETAYSSSVSVTTSACTSTSGGGGGFLFIKNSNQPLIDPKIMSINRNVVTTKSRLVRIRFGSTIKATHVAFSESLDFTDTSYLRFRRSMRVRLSPGVGQKTVYAKLRTQDNSTSIVLDVITYVPRQTRAITSTPAVVSVPAASSYVFTLFLSNGSTGGEVLELQKRLQMLGFFSTSFVPNGVFGPATETAVRALQSAHGIASVGYVGPATRAILNK